MPTMPDKYDACPADVKYHPLETTTLTPDEVIKETAKFKEINGLINKMFVLT